jgi:hypothetical protein
VEFWDVGWHITHHLLPKDMDHIRHAIQYVTGERYVFCFTNNMSIQSYLSCVLSVVKQRLLNWGKREKENSYGFDVR